MGAISGARIKNGLFIKKVYFLYSKHSLLISSKRKRKRKQKQKKQKQTNKTKQQQQQKKQDPSKPWLTPDIIKSIRIKNNLHKEFCQATKLPQKISLHQKVKNYRN